jgi:hypothetical protein
MAEPLSMQSMCVPPCIAPPPCASHPIFPWLVALQLNAERLQLVPPTQGGYPLPLRLVEAVGYEMPRDEAIGPLHLTQVGSGLQDHWVKPRTNQYRLKGNK